MNFTSKQLTDFCLKGEATLSHGRFVKVLGSELMHGNEIYDDHVSTTQGEPCYTWELLDKAFEGIDLAESFEQPLLIVYDELMPSRILIDLHFWLRQKCLNIQNIVLINTHHLGVRDWWKQWCNTNHEYSFQVLDVPQPPSMIKNYFSGGVDIIDRADPIAQKQKHLSHTFSYYGGLYGALERDYLALQMSEFLDTAAIDYLGEFADPDLFAGYVESLSYYSDQDSVDRLTNAYNTLVKKGKIKGNLDQFKFKISASKEKLNFRGMQWKIDKHCFATVIKETKANDRYPMVTEKTWRTFLNHSVAIPTSYQAVRYLESQGYWFPHEIFDYSYQDEPSYHYRIEKLKKSLTKLQEQCSIVQMKEFLVGNRDRFESNARKIFRLTDSQVWKFEDARNRDWT